VLIPDAPLSDVVTGWQISDEDEGFASLLRSYDIPAIQPGLETNKFALNGNAFLSTTFFYEICDELFSLTQLLEPDESKLPEINFSQVNGNYTENGPIPKIGFGYSVAVLKDSSLSGRDATAGYDRLLSRYGANCETKSSLEFYAHEGEYTKCAINRQPGLDTACINKDRDSYLKGRKNWMELNSSFSLNDSIGTSIASITNLVPYNTKDGIRKVVTVRRLEVDNPLFVGAVETSIILETSLTSISLSTLNNIALDVFEKFLALVHAQFALQVASKTGT